MCDMVLSELISGSPGYILADLIMLSLNLEEWLYVCLLTSVLCWTSLRLVILHTDQTLITLAYISLLSVTADGRLFSHASLSILVVCSVVCL